MNKITAARWLGAVAAVLATSLVASASPAQAAPDGSRMSIERRADTGWDIP